MRIACLHLPGFPLQVAARGRPDLAGRAVAVVGPGREGQLLACSRAAHAAGARAGMPASAARMLVPGLALERFDAGAAGETALDLVRALEALSPAVEPDLAGTSIYMEVPGGQRSQRFARSVLAAAAELGLTGRVGVAPDRFTAWVAARAGGAPVTVVSRRGAAGFLAPHPLELLPLAEEVRHLLRAAGVHTLGQFAALPPPSVDRPGALDYQALARGNGPAAIRPRCGGPQPARRTAPRPRPAHAAGHLASSRQLVLAS